MTSFSLSERILLNEQEIKKHLIRKNLSIPFALHLYTNIDSTNRFLKDLPKKNQLDICCAEHQTQGRGRFGREWHSPLGENIYCSSRWSLPYNLKQLSGLSLVTSLAILATLNKLQIGSNIKIKWPNDLYWNDKKLSGSLIEILPEFQGTTQVIIGIGLNVNSDTFNTFLPDKPWCSLYEITQHYFDRNLIIAELMSTLDHYLNKLINNDLTIFMDEWNRVDYLAGKHIQINQASRKLSGKACGINFMGQLILEDAFGAQHILSSGDTSLHSIL